MDASARAVAQAAQLGAIAAIAAIDITGLVDAFPLIEPFLAQELVVAIAGDGKAIAVVANVPDVDVTPWIAPLDSALGIGARPLTQLAQAARQEGELELRTSPSGLNVALRVLGRYSDGEERALLDVLGIQRATSAALATCFEHLPPDQRALVARVNTNSVEIEVGRVIRADTTTTERLDKLAWDIGISVHQRRLMAQLHPLLARGKSVLLTLTVSQRGIEPRLSLRYAPMPWDTALRFATGLYRGDTATRLGRFAGAVGGDQVAWLDVVLGDTEPPESWIAARQRLPAKNLA